MPGTKDRTKLIRVDQMAEQLGISRRSAYRLVAEGHFEALKVGGSLRVTQASVVAYVERQLAVWALENG